MRARRLTIVFLLLLGGSAAAGVSACSDTDPRYGPPEAIRGRKIDYGQGVTAEEDSGGGTGTPKTAPAAFADLYATFAGAGDGTKCTPCHAPGGTGGKFFVATDATSSRAFFLANGYEDIAKPNTFATKGQHSGNPLTAAQKTLTKTWSDAEKAAGGGTGTTTPEAGTGDGGI
jgi:hypothetical protein